MKLWLLTREHWGYDEVSGFVVRAEDGEQARQIVAERHPPYDAGSHFGDEGAATWLDPSQSTCVELMPDGEPGVILRDFRAG